MTQYTDMLVGYTGFVGSNIDAKHEFTYRINTQNSEYAWGKNPDLLIYAGVRAEKFLANSEPAKDMENIYQAFDHIRRIDPKQLVLISTVDVYKEPVDVDENSVIDIEGLAAYGLNRYRLEQMVRDEYADALIVRLPGLFGWNLKKNFIYDYINVIPAMLKADKFEQLAYRSPLIGDSYELQSNGFYRCVERSEQLKEEFKYLGFSALNFTDSRGVFQFYNLDNLYENIKIALANDIHLLNISTQPVSVSEIYSALTGGEEFVNEIAQVPPYYNYRSIHANLFGGKDGYFCDKEKVLQDIVDFVSGQV